MKKIKESFNIKNFRVGFLQGYQQRVEEERKFMEERFENEKVLLRKHEIEDLERVRQEERKAFEALIVTEINLARSAGETTSRLTGLYLKLKEKK